MAQLSQRQAAQQWSIPWTTFRRAITTGKVSVGSNKRVDVAEMVRAFGDPPAQAETGANGSSGSNSGPALDHPETLAMRTEIATLRDLVQRADAERDRALDMMRLLAHDRPSQPAPVPLKTRFNAALIGAVLIALGVALGLAISLLR